ncbi:MAG: hypothetical protein RI907_390 [Pseudomonadota bacterium]|jgi:ethanolamine ammonia-lyase small subunit
MTQTVDNALFPVPEGMIRVVTPCGVIGDIDASLRPEDLEALRDKLAARIAARRAGPWPPQDTDEDLESGRE